MAAIVLSSGLPPGVVKGRHVLRVTRNSNLPAEERSRHAMLISDDARVAGFPFVLTFDAEAVNALKLPAELRYLEEGDIIRLSAGGIRVVYRKASRHNVLFVTERCNSRCVMCSQPPREIDDGYLVGEILEAIPMMAPETPQLCITGGEPTLYFDGLVSIVRAVKEHLPKTSLHMLSNGRLFGRREYAKAIASIDHPGFMIGVPLYSDEPGRHDYVVQSKGAFEETIFGLLNLARYRQKVEIRFVIHRETLLSENQQKSLIARIRVIDASPDIGGARELLERELRLSTRPRFLGALCDRLEGWWFRSVIEHLTHPDQIPGISQRLAQVQLNDLQDQFREDNLPIDFPSFIQVDESALETDERVFVEQLKLLSLNTERIQRAISDYYRAFHQRSRWVREDLLLDEDLERYEERLVEEWRNLFLIMQEKVQAGGEAVGAGRDLYNDLFYTSRHIPIRPSFPDPFVMRGSFHMLANGLKVGWHAEFENRLSKLFNRALQPS